MTPGQQALRNLCTSCGRCCEKYGHDPKVDLEDIGRWVYENEHDHKQAKRLLYWTDIYMLDIWVSEKGVEPKKCPFLRYQKSNGHKQKSYCQVNDIKPNSCYLYPVDYEQAVRDGCEIVDVLFPEID